MGFELLSVIFTLLTRLSFGSVYLSLHDIAEVGSNMKIVREVLHACSLIRRLSCMPGLYMQESWYREVVSCKASSI